MENRSKMSFPNRHVVWNKLIISLFLVIIDFCFACNTITKYLFLYSIGYFCLDISIVLFLNRTKTTSPHLMIVFEIHYFYEVVTRTLLRKHASPLLIYALLSRQCNDSIKFHVAEEGHVKKQSSN